jgi:hypothetical protein
MAAMMIGENESGVTWLAPDQLVSTGMMKILNQAIINIPLKVLSSEIDPAEIRLIR